MRFELTRVTPIDFESIALTARPSCQTGGYTPHHATNTNTNTNNLSTHQHTNTPTHIRHSATHTSRCASQHTNNDEHCDPRTGYGVTRRTTTCTLPRSPARPLADQSTSPSVHQPAHTASARLAEMDIDSALALRLLDQRKEEKRQNRHFLHNCTHRDRLSLSSQLYSS